MPYAPARLEVSTQEGLLHRVVEQPFPRADRVSGRGASGR
jgi:hypothetical protein